MPDRHVKKHARYKEAVAALVREFPRAADVFRGAEWAIARAPEESGIHIPSIDVFRSFLICPEPIPSVHIYYTFDARQLRLLTIVPLKPHEMELPS